MKIQSFQDYFIDSLKDLYSAETQLIEALPKMANAATSAELRMAFQEHLEMTREQAARIESIFEDFDEEGDGKKCVGMQGLIKEGQELLKEDMEGEILDAALIGAAQRIEHYEIASYGAARTHAQMLGHQNAAQLLQQTLDEEVETDVKLTQLAEQGINRQAASE
jgi:ferritin-like metal-binding protein YciE